MGSFATRTTEGTDVISHSLGIVPKLILCYGTYLVRPGPAWSLGSNTLSVIWAFGATNLELANGGPDIQSVCRLSAYTKTSFSTNQGFVNGSPHFLYSSSVGHQLKFFEVDSWDADTFTITYTAPISSVAVSVSYVLFGGDNVESSIFTINAPTSTGNQVIDTGLADDPDLMIFIPWMPPSSTPYFGGNTVTAPNMGFTDGTRQGVSGVMHHWNSDPTRSNRYQRTDKCIAQLASRNEAETTITHQASIVSLNGDGTATINWDIVNADGLPVRGIAIRGINAYVGSFVGPGAPGESVVPVPTFSPTAALFTYIGATAMAADAAQANLRFSFGMADRSFQSVGAVNVLDNADELAHSRGRYYNEGGVIAALENVNGTDPNVVDLAAVQEDWLGILQFKVDWSALSRAGEVIFVALADATVETPIGAGTIGPLAWVEARWRTPGSP